jgi:glycosyltransferase involved in cell wall biosynthesis
MKEDKLVSIVIASYNSADFVPFAIRSALEQTYRNIEVHVVDDGSTDNTPEAVAPFLADPRVIYYRQKNMGQPFAKNKGIRESRGDFIAFIDADDVWHKGLVDRPERKYN